MPIIEFDPEPPLAAHVAGFWGWSVPADVRPGSSQALSPDGGVALISQRSPRGDARAALLGPRAETFELSLGPGDRIWAVRFWPDAGGAVLGEDPQRLAAHFVSPLTAPPWAALLLQGLAGCVDRDAVMRVAHALLRPAIEAAPPLDAAVRRAVQALIVTNGEMSIADVAAGVGLSLRQLERRFVAAVGLNPIQYARIRKMRGDLALMSGVALTWSGIAGELERARP